MKNLGYKTDDEVMCILVWYLWYSFAWIAWVIHIYIMSIVFNHRNNTTEKNDDTSKGMSTTRPKINVAVRREGEEDESGSDNIDKCLCSVV